MGVISFRNIRKRYPENIIAVQDFSLEVQDGEFLVLVGPSGCGKTTLLRMVAGLEDISSGELWIDGELINRVPPAERDIAMVFQNYALYPHMTVYQNMALALELRKIDRREIRRRIYDAAEVLDIEYLLNRKPRALSGGQRQRAALGRAMVRDPAVFLLDEPLSNLDAKLRTQMRTELIRLHERLHTTFIYVTHDQAEAMTMGDRIVVMRDGFIQQADRPQTLYERPANLFVAEFIGTPQMNRFQSKLFSDRAGLYVRLGETEIRLPAGEDTLERLMPFAGAEVAAGFRCEAYRQADGSAPALCGTVALVERLGAEALIHIVCEEMPYCLKLPASGQYMVGDTLRFRLAPEEIHLFSERGEIALYP